MTGLPCAEQAARLGGGIAGTAVSETWAWICLEVRASWGRKGLGDTDLPESIEALLRSAGSMAGARVQFIRRPQRCGDLPLVLLLADSRPGRERLVEVQLATLEALAEVDIAGFFEGALVGTEVEGPRYLVCTHGRRDLCCARLGMATWSELEQVAPEQTWQASHLGGHRFAPTLVALPEGVCFGQVRAGEAAALHSAWVDGEIADPNRVRGRSAYTSAEQAAEVLSGEMVRMAPERLEVPEGHPARLSWAGGAEALVDLECHTLGEAESSCGSGLRKPVVEWRRAEASVRA